MKPTCLSLSLALATAVSPASAGEDRLGKPDVLPIPGLAGPCMAAPAHEVNPSFAANLYRQLKSQPGNVFYSPYSITQAMGMAYLGARGETAAEFVKALSFQEDDQESFGNLSEHLRNSLHGFVNQGDNKLKIANALCVTGLTPRETYLNLVRTRFDAEIFTGGLDEINRWVGKKTDGNITKIIGHLDADSACVLLNAVYFKGTWRQGFNPKNTSEGDFHVTPEKPVRVEMMASEGYYAVARGDAWIAVELPYQTSASMVLVMPTEAGGFETLEKQFGEEETHQILFKELGKARSHPREIDLMVPKFKIETECDLVPAMKALGMQKAFLGNQADFGSMYDKEDISIARIKHKATLEVDEAGTVATAATALLVEYGEARMVDSIHFNRPFLVFIRENQTQTTLFMGRISNPAEK